MHTFLGFLLAFLLLFPVPVVAQQTPFPETSEEITLTLDEAIQIAMAHSHAMHSTRLDIESADQALRQSISLILPQVDASSSYTRNLKTANPFAGSSAGDLFSGFGSLGWLAYNEDARTDNDPTTIPITLDDFMDRQSMGRENAGIILNESSNPFAVDNQFQSSLNISQQLIDFSAFDILKTRKLQKEAFPKVLARQEQLMVDRVRQAFYQSLLLQEQVSVAKQSATRAEHTLHEIARRVSQGVNPKFQRLSAEVELTNRKTQLLETQNQAIGALDNLKLLLGIPIQQAVRLRGNLEAEDFSPYIAISTQDASSTAFQRRPDLEEARLNYEVQTLGLRIIRKQRMPSVSGFANLSYSGSVPDSRTFSIADEDDPFVFTPGKNDFFSSAYWQPAVNVGFRLTWPIFDGGSTSAIIEQRRVDRDRAWIDMQYLRQSIQLEVQTSLRNLTAAQQQIIGQEQNVSNAELNYDYVRTRLAEGVATPLEEREASSQLDQSRINYLQAVYNYLVARSAFETSMGIPLGEQTDMQLTSN